ncbi:MAG: SDR family oxidoreductase [Gammaproteobacteria bacterium]|nr:SDR family oxidoreductase [Gammaproteobacteria bacterium]
MLIGASGFIGSAVLARLRSEGHRVLAVARRRGGEAADVEWRELDIARATSPEAWRPHLADVDAVVNCAGVLQDAPGDSTRGVHVDGIDALYRACEAVGVRRVVHLSAIGADREPLTAFSETKQAGERALMQRDLDWVVLRPSVVVGRAAYGGSALLRALAALPVLASVPDAGELQIVQLADVVATVLFFVDPAAPSRVALDVAGPERLAFEDVVLIYRRWLRLPPPRRLAVPRSAAALAYRLGDAAGLLGWRTPMRSNARKEFSRGAVGDPEPWSELTGIRPRRLEDALAAEPASVQERWFARLFFLKPVVFAVFAAFWIVTGIISLGPGWEVGVEYMQRGGAGAVAVPGVIAGAVADILVGIGIAFRRTARAALYAALALSLFYMVTGTLVLPVLWADPIGPMMKIWPIMALNLVALAILEDR